MIKLSKAMKYFKKFPWETMFRHSKTNKFLSHANLRAYVHNSRLRMNHELLLLKDRQNNHLRLSFLRLISRNNRVSSYYNTNDVCTSLCVYPNRYSYPFVS